MSFTSPRSLVSLTALAAFGLSGCASSAPPVLEGPVAPPMAMSGASGFSGEEGAEPIRPKDKLSIIVQREPDFSLPEVRVAEDGQIDMPFIGRVTVAGLTPAEIGQVLQARLGESYLVAPRVSVNVLDYASHVVTVEGSVAQPGIFQFQPDTTLLGAVALARGTSRVARLDQVAIFRNEDGQRSVAVFDLRQVRSGQMVDPVLRPGDRVIVGFSGLTQAWQDFLQAVPLLALFTRF